MPKKRALKTSKRTKATAVIFGVINWSVQKKMNVGRLLAADRRKKAKTKVAKGQAIAGTRGVKSSGSVHGLRRARDR